MKIKLKQKYVYKFLLVIILVLTLLYLFSLAYPRVYNITNVQEESINHNNNVEIKITPLIKNWMYLWSFCDEKSIALQTCRPLESHQNKWQDFSFPKVPSLIPLATSLWIKTTIPNNNLEHPTIYLGGFSDFIEVFIDNKLVYQNTKPSNSKVVFPKEFNSFQIPLNNSNKNLMIHVKFIRADFAPMFFERNVSIRKILIGEQLDIVKTLIYSSLIPVFIGIISLAIGMFWIGLFLAQIKKSMLLYLYAGGFAVAIGIYIISRCEAMGILTPSPTLWFSMEYFSLYLVTLCFGKFLLSIFSNKVPKILCNILSASIYLFMLIFFAAIIVMLCDVASPSVFLTMWHYVCIIAIPSSIILVAIDSWFGNKDAKIILLGFLAFAIIGLAEILDNLQIVHWFGGNSIIQWGVLLFITSMFMVLANRFREIYYLQKQLSETLEHALQGYRELTSLQNNFAIAQLGAQQIFKELGSVADSITECHVIFPLNSDNNEYEKITFIKNAVAINNPISETITLPLISNINTEPWFNDLAINIPFWNRNKLWGILVANPVENPKLSENTTRSIKLFATSIAICLENAKAWISLTQAIKRESEKEHSSLIHRIAVAAMVSDKLNSPLLVASNIYQIMHKKFNLFTATPELLCDKEECTNIRKSFINGMPHLKEAIDSIHALSLELATLRDAHHHIEATDAMKAFEEEEDSFA